MGVLGGMLVCVGMFLVAFCLPLWIVGSLPEPNHPTIYGPAGEWCRRHRRVVLICWLVGLPVLALGAASGWLAAR